MIFSRLHPKLVFLWSQRYDVINIVYCYWYVPSSRVILPVPTPCVVQTLQTDTTANTPNPRKRVWRSHGVKVTLLEEKNIPAHGVRLECHCIRGSRIILISCFGCYSALRTNSVADKGKTFAIMRRIHRQVTRNEFRRAERGNFG